LQLIEKRLQQDQCDDLDPAIIEVNGKRLRDEYAPYAETEKKPACLAAAG